MPQIQLYPENLNQHYQKLGTTTNYVHKTPSNFDVLYHWYFTRRLINPILSTVCENINIQNQCQYQHQQSPTLPNTKPYSPENNRSRCSLTWTSMPLIYSKPTGRRMGSNLYHASSLPHEQESDSNNPIDLYAARI